MVWHSIMVYGLTVQLAALSLSIPKKSGSLIVNKKKTKNKQEQSCRLLLS
jgi:hypothetical protein